MKQQMFCIYDSKAKAFNQPFFMPNVPMAIRAFGVVANDPESNICRTPEDYTLFHVGEFDDENAGVTPLLPIVSLSLASQLKKG